MIRYKNKKYELSTSPFSQDVAKGRQIKEQVSGKIVAVYLQIVGCYCIDLFTNFVYMPTQNPPLLNKDGGALDLYAGANIVGFDQPYFTEIQELKNVFGLNEINLLVKSFRDFSFINENNEYKEAQITISIAYEVCNET